MLKRSAFRPLIFLKLTRERGAILPMAAVGLISVLGAMGLSLDVGNVYVAKQELQAAANAAALKSASSLVLDPVSGQPDPKLLTDGVKVALQKLGNTSNGQVVISPEVAQNGYVSILGYDIASHQIVGSFDPTKNQIPAVQVNVIKQGLNGPVDTFFSKVLGVSAFTPKASAIAIPGTAPSSAAPGQIIPVAVPKSLMNALWDPTTNQPKTAQVSTPLYSNGPRQSPGSPYAVRVWDNGCGIPKTQTLTDHDHTEICKDDDHKTGVWHSYNSASNYSYSNQTVRTKNDKEISEKDDVYLCKTSDASKARQSVLSNTKGGEYAGYVAVVEGCSNSNTYSGSKASIHAFAAVKILRSGSEELCDDSRCEEKVRCGYVDLQLIRRGEREDSVSNKDEYSPVLEGHGVTQSEHSYVDGAPKLCLK
jgi:Flp pilus assembly protein TadG